MHQSDEENFPRGGFKCSLEKSTRIKEVKDRDLFKEANKTKKTKAKKRKLEVVEKKGKKRTKLNVGVLDKTSRNEALTIQNLSPGVVVLGCVKEVHEFEVIMSLPNNLSGCIPITSVSDAYLQLLQSLAKGDHNQEEVHDLNELFHVGTILPCKVTSVQRETEKKTVVKLSVNPSEVNQELTSSALRNGMGLYGSVASQEDHGYIIDLGVKNIRAFLKNKDAERYIQLYNDGFPLMVGKPVLCQLETDVDRMARLTGETRAINVSIDPKKTALAQTKETNNLNWLVPGMKVKAKVKNTSPGGITVMLDSSKGFISRSHLPNSPDNYKNDQKIVASILYIQPTTKVVYLSCLDHIVQYNGVGTSDWFGNLQVGSIIEEAKILRVDTTGIVLKLSDELRGIASVKNLSDDPVANLSSTFPKGSKQRCRVLDFDFMDRMVIVTLRKSILEQTFLNIKDLESGSLVVCTVKTLTDKGVTVKVTNKIQGFIPSLHLADVPLKHPEKKFEAGKVLKCRILSVDKARQRVKLTNKKSLVNSKYPILTSFAQLETGLELEGFIGDVKDQGCLVVFYNDMKGWVPTRELSSENIPFPQKVFYKGQVVRCAVKTWSEEANKITLTFKLDDKAHFGTKQAAVPDEFEIGKLTNCRVKGKSEKGLEVVLLPSKIPAFLPSVHLSESGTMQDLLYHTYKASDLIKDAMYLNQTNIIMLTLRPSMITASRAGHIVQTVSDLQQGMVLPAAVKNLMNYGIFVELAGGLVGLVPNKFATDHRMNDYSLVYKVGQPVMVKVTEIDVSKGRFLGSMTMADCYLGDTNISLDLLENYLNDRDRVHQHLKNSKDKKISAVSNIEVGEVCSVIIDEVTEIGVIGHLEDSKVKGFATEDHIQDVSVKPGDKVEAVVLYVDLSSCSIEFSLTKNNVRHIKRRSNDPTNQAKVDQHMKADVLLVKPEFILISLRGHAMGHIAYLPAKRHLNDVLEVHQFSPGQVHPIIVKRVGKHVLCNLVIHEKEEKGEDSRTCVSNKKSTANQKLLLGDRVEAQIRKIHSQQMDLIIGNKHGRVHITEVADQVVEGEFPFSKFKESQMISVRIISFRHVNSSKFLTVSSKNQNKLVPECTLKPSKWSLVKEKLMDNTRKKYKVGDRVQAFVHKYTKYCLWFDVSLSTRGRCAVLNLSNSLEVLSDPESHFKSGCGYHATVIGIGQDGLLDLSLIGKKEIVEGQCAVGWISKIIDKTGLFIRLGDGYQGVVRLTDISDQYADHPLQKYKQGQYVQCFVKLMADKEQCLLSLRDSRIKGQKSEVTDPEVTKETVEVGQVLRGYVVDSKESSILVSIGCNLCGKVSKENCSDSEMPDLPSAYSIGSLVTVKVTKISKNKINLTMKMSSIRAMDSTHELKGINLKARKKSLSESSSHSDVLEGEENSRKRKIKVKDGRKEISKSKKRKVNTDSDTDSGLGEIKQTEDSESDMDIQTPNLSSSSKSAFLRLGVTSDFSWSTDFSGIAEDVGQSDESDDQSHSKTETGNMKKTKQQLKKEKIEKEKKLYEQERQRLEGEVTPQTAEEFDRLVLQSPDSSIVWLRYMAFHLETTEIEKARAVAERALKTISFREEQEKMNVWAGYLNLENMYGTPELLNKVLERALQQNEPINIYQQMVNIYIKSGKTQEAEQLYNTMSRKLSHQKDIWVGFGQFYFTNERFESARKLLQRCLKCLDKRFHVETIAKFAQMEFKYGEPERGKTMYENILSNYPKRTDLWSVYIDMVTKLGEIEGTRQIFERVISLKLSAKKMKFFFKKYLDFEKAHGTEKTIVDVKSKALAYVESKGYVED